MKIERDVVIAIIVGVLVGGLAAFFVFFLPKFLPETPPKTEKEEVAPALSPTPSSFLTLENPKDEAIFSEDEISVSGKTRPGSLVVIVSPVDEEAIEADSKGNFETKISLEEGANEISITSYGEEDREETKAVTVYYTEEEIE